MRQASLAAPRCARQAGALRRFAASATAAPEVATATDAAAPVPPGVAGAVVGAVATMKLDAQALAGMTDAEVLNLLNEGALSVHTLESTLGNSTRAVYLRRAHTAAQIDERVPHIVKDVPALEAIEDLPVTDFDTEGFYNQVLGANCESVIGYLPLPVGKVGPLKVDGRELHVPLATTEGALIASTNRGARAITLGGGATTVVTGDGMTRAPLLRMASLADAARIQQYLEDPDNVAKVIAAFNSTTRFGKMVNVKAFNAGRFVFLRFRCKTGDAMGMNMISKGVSAALDAIADEFPGARLLSLSGNACTDKKPSAINWIEGRGKSVTCEAVIPKDVVKKVLKTNVDALVELNVAKNLIGSAVAGSIGGYNAHAANIVSAVFLATGQDVAQNVESSTCMTLMEKDGETGDLICSVTMPSIEVGTVGGGTTLPAQSACLRLLGIKGAADLVPGTHASMLARAVAASVLCGELSLMAALTSGDLVSSHMKLNRKPADAAPTRSFSTKRAASGSDDAEADAAVALEAAGAPSRVVNAFRESGRASYSSAAAVETLRYATASDSPGRAYFKSASMSPAQQRVAAATFEPLLTTP